ncbi:glycosyltransferase [Desertimonas flava]|uniref:glycosyltransferase n=1 Tax=Desertimonas flava TaxID=2064846 RepID=UPI001D0C4981
MRLWGNHARILEHPDEHELPAFAARPARQAGPLRLVFVSRVVEHKGLHVLLQALQEVRSPLSLDIFGPIEDPKYFERCKEIAEFTPKQIALRWCGDLRPEEVRPILAARDALCLPTRSENFGHVIAESLSVSTIVLTTPTTPWSDTILAGGGALVPDRSPHRWAATIESLAVLTDDELHARRHQSGASYDEWAAAPRPNHLWERALRETPTCGTHGQRATDARAVPSSQHFRESHPAAPTTAPPNEPAKPGSQ